MAIYDPTFIVQSEPPHSMGRLNTPYTAGHKSTLQFRGRTITCWPATAHEWHNGEQVIIAQLRNEQSVAHLKADSGYPTRWPRQAATWGNEHAASVALRYMLEGNDKHYTYERGTVVAQVDDTHLRVKCVDGVVRVLPCRYMDDDTPASAFDPNDQCLIYSECHGERVVIGFIDQEPKDTTQIDDVGTYWPVACRNNPWGEITFVLYSSHLAKWKVRHYISRKEYSDTEPMAASGWIYDNSFAIAHDDTIWALFDKSMGMYLSLDFGGSWNTAYRPTVPNAYRYEELGRVENIGGNPMYSFCYKARYQAPNCELHRLTLTGSGLPWSDDSFVVTCNNSDAPINPSPAIPSGMHYVFSIDGITYYTDQVSPPQDADPGSSWISLDYRLLETVSPSNIWIGRRPWENYLIVATGAGGITTRRIINIPAGYTTCYGALKHASGVIDALMFDGANMQILRVSTTGTATVWAHPAMTGSQVYSLSVAGDGRAYYGLWDGTNGKIISIPPRLGA